MACSRMAIIRSIGATPLGQTCTHSLQRVQSQMPVGSLRPQRRSIETPSASPSRGSAVKRYAFASAAGPRKVGSTSSTVQSETHAPHIMQAVTPDRWSIASLETMYSPSGSWPMCFRYGSTASIFSQNRSKLTTRSLMTGITPAGSTVMTPSCATVLAMVLQARAAWPLIRIAQEPQMALRQEQRRDSVPSSSSRIWISASRTVALSGIVTG